MNDSIGNESIGLPAGFRDVLFDEARKRRSVEDNLARVFDNAGYGEVIPSGIEFFETYVRGDKGIQDRLFRFLNRDDVLFALRADFTLAVARIAATRFAHTAPPHRIWYCGNVFRKADPAKGHYKETFQVGAELLGVNSAKSDAEILLVALQCLEALGVNDVQLHLNHAGVFKGVVDSLGLNETALKVVRAELDRKDMRALTSRLDELGVGAEAASHLGLLSRSLGGESMLDEVAKTINSSASLAALAELKQLGSALGKWKHAITFDLTEIDELEYYTGIFFTFFSPKLRAELGRGGRYDGMLAKFGAPMPAVGFSFAMEELVRL